MQEQSPILFWSLPTDELLHQLQATPQGLSAGDAAARLARYGPNHLKPRKRADALTLFLRQFTSPIILMLLFAALLSFFLGDRPDAVIIFAIIFISGLLGFWQEHGAARAVEALLATVQTKVTVLRDGRQQTVPFEDIVPGEVIVLSAGCTVPGDCLILESHDLFVDEAALTGETYPVEKAAGVLPESAPLAQRMNSLFMGTHVVSGTGTALVVVTGTGTEFGRVSQRLRLRPPEPEFERGVRRFGYFLMEVTLMLVIAIFAVNVALKRPVLDSFLFSVALAVGLTPQLLPAIVSVNLAHGARRMAAARAIVKRLSSIENFGSMSVLCSDKTGTLTEGKVRVDASLDLNGNDSQKVLLHAFLNASFETGFANPIDDAIRAHCNLDLTGYEKLDEVPYDFTRKRLSILVEKDGARIMIVKGALSNVLDACSSAETSEGVVVDLAAAREGIQKRFEDISAKGLRTLGLAYRDVGSASRISTEDEKDLVFLGFLVLSDPVKAGIVDTLAELQRLGVTMKMVTGDNRLVAAHIGEQLGWSKSEVVTGADLHAMSDEALIGRARDAVIFAEVEPNQKERIILALRKSGQVVGYLGDGINDASALHAADAGISVDGAVDVAREAADIVLLEKDLAILAQAVQEGRRTFANTVKYVFMATSANFGNMFSMAGASLFLPFLPLLPTQILLTNLLTDLPEMTIATDAVDRELVEEPHRWDIQFIRRFMVTFGPVSSVFDYLTFGALLLVLHASRSQFRTGWFIESVVSAAVIVLVVRTRRPFFASRPSTYLALATLIIVLVAVALPWTPLAPLFGFRPLPPSFLLMVAAILVLYIGMAEVAKAIFYRHTRF